MASPPLVLKAPLAGWAAPLDEAPDAVFAGRLLGDGVAIDPVEGLLVAPCDGVVLTVARTRHAVTLRADSGAEILMHVGVDTVALEGEGFEALVSEGARVAEGQPLLRFDLDAVARQARSLLTPVIVTNGEAFEIVGRHEGLRVGAGDPLLELRAVGSAQSAAGQPEAPWLRRELITGLEHGLHARPSALLVAALKPFAAEVRVEVRGRSADARSATSLMTLGVKRGDRLAVSARGADAEAALAALVGQLAEVDDHAPGPSPLAVDCLTGVCAAPGLALGPAVRLRRKPVEVAARGRGAAIEGEALEQARRQVRERVEALSKGASGASAQVLAAHLVLLDDPVLLEKAEAAIAMGASAGAAWSDALRAQADALAALDDPRMAERRADLLDLERQVLAALSGEATETPELPGGAILLAEDLLPSELAALDAGRLGGVALEKGGATAHVAIIAAGLGVPMLVALGPSLAQVSEGEQLLLDADAGLLRLHISDAEAAAFRRRRAARQARRAAAAAVAQEEARTTDGERIEVFANLGSAEEAASAVAQGAEGCGLLRTEFLFQDRASPPDEEEQRAAYQAVADAMAGRPLVIRTLDIGNDKPAPYLDLPREENPALGLRGLRIGLWKPEVLRTQLRAVLRVEAPAVSLMLPMVASLGELRAARAMLEEEAQALGRPALPLGVMIETPAAAVTARTLAAEAAFFSIGSNDLTQYALAMDRTQPVLAPEVDGLHPAVLGLIAQAAEGAAAHERPVGVCGGLASEPAAVPLLIGLGARELSATPSQVAEIKAAVRGLSLEDCRAVAREALSLASAAEVRTLVAARWPELGEGA